jgi:dynein light chain 1, axonemal
MNVTPMKDAVKYWEKKTGEKIISATEIKLNGIFPPLDRMDPMISTFVACE